MGKVKGLPYGGRAQTQAFKPVENQNTFPAPSNIHKRPEKEGRGDMQEVESCLSHYEASDSSTRQTRPTILTAGLMRCKFYVLQMLGSAGSLLGGANKLRTEPHRPGDRRVEFLAIFGSFLGDVQHPEGERLRDFFSRGIRRKKNGEYYVGSPGYGIAERRKREQSEV